MCRALLTIDIHFNVTPNAYGNLIYIYAFWGSSETKPDPTSIFLPEECLHPQMKTKTHISILERTISLPILAVHSAQNTLNHHFWHAQLLTLLSLLLFLGKLIQMEVSISMLLLYASAGFTFGLVIGSILTAIILISRPRSPAQTSIPIFARSVTPQPMVHSRTLMPNQTIGI